MVPTPKNFALSSYSANSTSEIAKIYLRMIPIRSIVLSFLKGTALDCFESAVLDPIKPPWLSDFNLFLEELKANFGTYNPVSEAEVKLEGLCMHESHQAMKYFIKIQQLATHVQWGDAALRRQAYIGLAKCIKDDMVHHEKLNTLIRLRLMHNTGNK